MGHLSKKYCIALTKSHATDGTFIAETQDETNFEKETEGAKDLEVEDWNNNDDSEWEEDIDLKLAETNYKRLLNLEL
ncbi:1724_t:CDS:1, partial [Funneliformis caledonium]